MSADVDKLRALEAAASGAPWRFVNDGTTVDITSGERIIAGVWDYDCAGIQYRSDAVFIAAARNALPSLLDEIERLRAENAELRRLLNGINADAVVADIANLLAENADLKARLRAATERCGNQSMSYGVCKDRGGSCPACRADLALLNDTPEPTMAEPLTFEQVREVNASRVRRWHPGFPDDADWTGADWSNALCGEAGELANVVKKLRRYECGLKGELDPGEDELKAMLAHECADVFLYLDLLAQFYGIDLPAAVVEKFNIVSERQGFPERLVLPATPEPTT